jgi:hypothetical protein
MLWCQGSATSEPSGLNELAIELQGLGGSGGLAYSASRTGSGSGAIPPMWNNDAIRLGPATAPLPSRIGAPPVASQRG